MSFAATRALTTGNAFAFEVLMDLIRARGCGLRSTLPQIMPGMVVSAANAARPVTLSTPSGRMVRWPIHLLLVIMFMGEPPAFQPRLPERRGRSCHSRYIGRDCLRAINAPPPRSDS